MKHQSTPVCFKNFEHTSNVLRKFVSKYLNWRKAICFWNFFDMKNKGKSFSYDPAQILVKCVRPSKNGLFKIVNLEKINAVYKRRVSSLELINPVHRSNFGECRSFLSNIKATCLLYCSSEVNVSICIHNFIKTELSGPYESIKFMPYITIF